MDDVVRDQPILEITAAVVSLDVEHEQGSNSDAVSKADHSQVQPTNMPSSYRSEVSGVVTIAPGRFALFSVPTNHVGAGDGGWHMEIPFWFRIPKGHGPRDAVIGGEPTMSLRYSHYDLPEEVKVAIAKPK